MTLSWLHQKLLASDKATCLDSLLGRRTASHILANCLCIFSNPALNNLAPARLYAGVFFCSIALGTWYGSHQVADGTYNGEFLFFCFLVA